MSRVRTLAPRWAPLSLPNAIPVLAELENILLAWSHTEYGSGQRCRGIAADCIGFVCGALDDIDGRARARDPRIPPDSALHDPERSKQAMRDILAVYEPWVPVRDALEPFDVVIVGPAGGGPGHAMLVGTRRNTLWHCSQERGVHMSGWSLGEGYESLHAAFRLGDRERWIR
jgi:hypothetical protein